MPIFLLQTTHLGSQLFDTLQVISIPTQITQLLYNVIHLGTWMSGSVHVHMNNSKMSLSMNTCVDKYQFLFRCTKNEESVGDETSD